MIVDTHIHVWSQLDGMIVGELPVVPLRGGMIRIRTVGPGGGYCCGSSNSVTEYVPQLMASKLLVQGRCVCGNRVHEPNQPAAEFSRICSRDTRDYDAWKRKNPTPLRGRRVAARQIHKAATGGRAEGRRNSPAIAAGTTTGRGFVQCRWRRYPANPGGSLRSTPATRRGSRPRLRDWRCTRPRDRRWLA